MCGGLVAPNSGGRPKRIVPGGTGPRQPAHPLARAVPLHTNQIYQLLTGYGCSVSLQQYLLELHQARQAKTEQHDTEDDDLYGN